jgi:arabinose-5-phosphate isomerase
MNAATTRFVEDATLLSAARRALAIEARAVDALGARLGPEFVAACRLCLACTGRVIVTGIGKSGHVGRKIAATLASTGTPGFFLHAAEASHGDLGMITASDVVLALSNSGESPELVFLLPHLKRLATPLITLTGNLASTLARNSTAEPCPHGEHDGDAGHGRCACRHPARGARLHRH